MNRMIGPRPAKELILYVLVAVVGLTGAAPALGQLRIVNYNVAQLNGDTNAMLDVFEALNDDDKPGFALPPDVYIFQEVRNAQQNNLLTLLNIAAPAGVVYTLATYTNNNEDGVGGAQALIYRDEVWTEDAGAHLDIFTGAGRRTDRWRLTLDGYDNPEVSIYIYGSHLKAGSSSSDEQVRHDGVIAIRNNADNALPDGTNIIYAGDMNFSGNTEDGYQEFISAGPAQAVDPLGSGSWFGSSQALKHSQSPCLSGCPLIGGGMDDRFDFQLSTLELQDGSGIALIPGTYRAFGNDGMHFDQSINSGNNFYYPGDLARSNALADALFAASDHLPVLADYQVPAVMWALLLPTDYGRVIQGAEVSVDLTVLNNVIATTPEGVDMLSFEALAGEALSGMYADTIGPPPDFASASFPVDTSTVGQDVSGVVLVFTETQEAQDDLQILNTTGTVLRPSEPSFSGATVVSFLNVAGAYEADTGVHPIDVDVHNFGFDDLQALLDVDDVSGVTAPFSLMGGLPAGIGAAPATLSFAIDTTGLADGVYIANVTISTSDEDLPGETTATLDLMIEATVGSACSADLDGSGTVDGVDLALLLGAWGPNPGDPADLDGDGVVNAADLALLLGSWGSC